jgi:hypothetical protein
VGASVVGTWRNAVMNLAEAVEEFVRSRAALKQPANMPAAYMDAIIGTCSR